MVSPIVATSLAIGIMTIQTVFILAAMPGCIVVCDSHACDAKTIDEDGRQQEGCIVYRSDENGTHAYRVVSKTETSKCEVPIAHGLRCLVRI